MIEMRLQCIVKRIIQSNAFTESVFRNWQSRPRRIRAGGASIVITDLSKSLSHAAILREFHRDVYGLRAIPFEAGDVVVDIGAHVGVESIFLAKRYPFLKIYAFEPVPANFDSLQANLAANDIRNVEAFRKAVTADGRSVRIWADLVENSGGGGHDRPAEHFVGRTEFAAESVTLDSIFEDNEIGRCKLLKIDCEGAEHEILRASSYLERVEYLSGEFHVDRYLSGQGHSIDGLLAFIAERIEPSNIRIVRDEQL